MIKKYIRVIANRPAHYQDTDCADITPLIGRTFPVEIVHMVNLKRDQRSGRMTPDGTVSIRVSVAPWNGAMIVLNKNEYKYCDQP